MTILAEAGRDVAAGAGDVRVLRPLRLSAGPTGDVAGRGPFIGVAVDVETTGLDPSTANIIELAVRRFRYDADGVISDIDEAYEWREDPGEPLPAEITALTGLSDPDLAGHRIDEGKATKLLRSASFVVAHNSGFDRGFIERRLEGARGLNWCCSMRQVDWRARGFDGRVLGYLLLQHGLYFCGHRASVDVDALIEMLRHRDGEGRTALSEMIVNGAKPSWIVRARGAAFDLKDVLRARGYRWDSKGKPKAWCREVGDDQLADEQFWLAANVYAPEARPSAICPETIRIGPRTRFL